MDGMMKFYMCVCILPVHMDYGSMYNVALKPYI